MMNSNEFILRRVSTQVQASLVPLYLLNQPLTLGCALVLSLSYTVSV